MADAQVAARLAELPNSRISQFFSSPPAEVFATDENKVHALRDDGVAQCRLRHLAERQRDAERGRAARKGFEPLGSRVTSFAPRRSASATAAGVSKGAFDLDVMHVRRDR